MKARCDPCALGQRERTGLSRWRLGASRRRIRGRRDDPLRRVEARRDDPGRPRERQDAPQRPQRIRDHRLRQTQRPQRIVTVTRAATRVGVRTAGKPQEPCMNHEIGDVAEGACLRSEPGIDVAIEDPAHLCRSIWPRTPEIVIRSGNP